MLITPPAPEGIFLLMTAFPLGGSHLLGCGSKEESEKIRTPIQNEDLKSALRRNSIGVKRQQRQSDNLQEMCYKVIKSRCGECPVFSVVPPASKN